MKNNKRIRNKQHEKVKDMQQEELDPQQETPQDEKVVNEECPQEQNEEQTAEAGQEAAAEDELTKLKAQLAETSDKYVRMVAEFDNYRRRTAKERLDLIGTASKDVLVGFLPILDDCERALEVLRKSEAAEAAIEGTELIYTKLMNYLKSKGVARIEAKGAEFDTDFHEAVAQFPAPTPDMKNKVIDVTEQGYTLNGTVIRFAKVVVGI
jgi:Molecular chaperone GrpE (heat shock protein)